MAIKTFTPFGKGKRIKADEWDAAFQLDGLQGTIEGITGEQVAKEGITCDVVNKGRAGGEGSATTDASGCPYYFGRKSTTLSGDWIHQGRSGHYVGGILSATELMNEIDWTDQKDLLGTGDVIIIEAVGRLDTVTYGRGDWNSDGTGTEASSNTPGAVVVDPCGGCAYWSMTDAMWSAYFASLSFQQNTTVPNTSFGGWEEPHWQHHCAHHFTPWLSYEVLTWGNAGVGQVWTRGKEVFDGATNYGPGKGLDFRMQMYYPVDGTETALRFCMYANPAAGPGSFAGAFADPGIKIYSDFTMYSHVIRKGKS